MRQLSIFLIGFASAIACYGQQTGRVEAHILLNNTPQKDFYCDYAGHFTCNWGENHADSAQGGSFAVNYYPPGLSVTAQSPTPNVGAQASATMTWGFYVTGPSNLTGTSVPLKMDYNIGWSADGQGSAGAYAGLLGDTLVEKALSCDNGAFCQVPKGLQGTLSTTAQVNRAGGPSGSYQGQMMVSGLTYTTATANANSYIYVDPSYPNASQLTVLVVPGVVNVPPPPALQFVPVTPCRIIDTRNANGTFGGPFIPGGGTRTIPITSSACNIPSTAKSYSLNATVLPKTATLGYLTMWPTGQPQPVVSTLNSPDGSVLANAAIVPAGTGGSINAFVTNDVELVLDINGYYIPPGPGTLQFYPVTPCRVLDTRNANGTFGGPALAAGATRSFPIVNSSCGIPATAQAYSLNVTVVPLGLLGYLTVWPTNTLQPTVSTLNSVDGTVVANAAVVPAGTAGDVSFFAPNNTHLVVDINGYFAPPGTGGLNFYPVTPCRVVDTRNASAPLAGPIINANTSRTFPVSTSSCGLPALAAAYSLNMTVVPSGSLGYITAWPTGQPRPTASTLNAPKGLVRANAALLPAGTSGSVDVYVVNTTHLVVDTNGYFDH